MAGFSTVLFDCDAEAVLACASCCGIFGTYVAGPDPADTTSGVAADGGSGAP